ncbi:Hypothetical predicted protein [Olea europaea subsp. europaea]|uniref:Uncharacterized protein n=1 Tax=Olea europaea subsp. europaea TaxID=158383 RepID=A0A8S0RVB6_OLEEU|nr:Hypothetical predicted protein [Olea europaea subsp. europaea]
MGDGDGVAIGGGRMRKGGDGGGRVEEEEDEWWLQTVSLDGPIRGENGASLSSNVKNPSDDSPILEKNVRKEKRKSNSAKKLPKPSRPPRGLSLDAAEQKLIKEIAELAMIKRARIKLMKTLKNMKTAKHSSMSSLSGNLIAMTLTLLL